VVTQAHRVSLVTERQVSAAGEVLAQALVDDPLCVYTQPHIGARLNQFAWFFAQLVRAGVEHESAYCHTSLGRPDGVAVWKHLQTVESTPELDGMEERFGAESYRRFTDYRHFEHVHRQCMTGPHWYLSVIGVAPGSQEQGIGAALLDPGLRKADREGLPCYLETFASDNVAFYEHRGFEVIAAGVHLGSRIPLWAMRREPSSA
jgi:GNAT superfamily N-acetyltransferase